MSESEIPSPAADFFWGIVGLLMVAGAIYFLQRGGPAVLNGVGAVFFAIFSGLRFFRAFRSLTRKRSGVETSTSSE